MNFHLRIVELRSSQTVSNASEMKKNSAGKNVGVDRSLPAPELGTA